MSGSPCLGAGIAPVLIAGDDDRRTARWPGNTDVVMRAARAGAGLVAEPPTDRNAGAKAVGAGHLAFQPSGELGSRFFRQHIAGEQLA